MTEVQAVYLFLILWTLLVYHNATKIMAKDKLKNELTEKFEKELDNILAFRKPNFSDIQIERKEYDIVQFKHTEMLSRRMLVETFLKKEYIIKTTVDMLLSKLLSDISKSNAVQFEFYEDPAYSDMFVEVKLFAGIPVNRDVIRDKFTFMDTLKRILR